MACSGRQPPPRASGIVRCVQQVCSHPVLPFLLVFLASLLARLTVLPDEVVPNADGVRHQLFALECASGGPCLTDLAVPSRFGLPHGAVWVYVVQGTQLLGLSYEAVALLLCLLNAGAVTALFALLRKGHGTVLSAVCSVSLVFLPESVLGESFLWNPSLLLFMCVIFLLSARKFLLNPSLFYGIILGCVAAICVQLHLIFLFFFLQALIVISPGLNRTTRLAAELGALWGLVATWVVMSPMLLVQAETLPVAILAMLYLPASWVYSWMANRLSGLWPWAPCATATLGPMRLIALAWALLGISWALISEGNLYYSLPAMVAAPLLLAWCWEACAGLLSGEKAKRLGWLGAGAFAAAFALNLSSNLIPKDGASMRRPIAEADIQEVMDRIVENGGWSFLEIQRHLWAGNRTDEVLRRLLITWRKSGRVRALALAEHGEGGKRGESLEICVVPDVASPRQQETQEAPLGGELPKSVPYRVDWRDPVLDLANSWVCVSWDSGRRCACRPHKAVENADADRPAPEGIAWSHLMDMGQWPLPEGEAVYEVLPIKPGLSSRTPVTVAPALFGVGRQCQGEVVGDPAAGVVAYGAPDSSHQAQAVLVPGGAPGSRLVVLWTEDNGECQGVSSLAAQNQMPLPQWGESPGVGRAAVTPSDAKQTTAYGQEEAAGIPESCEQAMAGTAPDSAPRVIRPRQERFWVRPVYVTLLVGWTMALLLLLPLWVIRPRRFLSRTCRKSSREESRVDGTGGGGT